MPDSTQPNFVGKHVLLYTAISRFGSAMLMESPRLEMQAGRLFLVGKISMGEVKWVRDLPVGIAWDRVDTYIVFDSAEQYLQRTAEANAENLNLAAGDTGT